MILNQIKNAVALLLPFTFIVPKGGSQLTGRVHTAVDIGRKLHFQYLKVTLIFNFEI